MSGEVKIRVDGVVDEYLAKGDASSENANCMWTPNGLLYAVGGEGLERDNLKRLEEAGFGELADMHRNGAVHIHDLSLGFTTPYCAGHSLPNLLADGINSGMIKSNPAKHLRTAINHMINFIGAASNEFAGAQAFSDIDIHLAPFAYKSYLDNLHAGCDADTALRLTKKEVKQSVQEFMFHLNYNNRWGGQTPFTNITLAITCPKDLENNEVLVAGSRLSEHPAFDESCDLIYGKLHVWQQMIVDAILDCFLEGDAEGNGFTFPVLTINVTEEFFSHPVRKKVFELAAKFGTPFFQNYINGISGGQKINPDDVRSMCCRLTLDKREIQKHVGGLFGNADQTGSLQVVTISLPYLAMQAKRKQEEFGGVTSVHFIDILCETMKIIRDEQIWKRNVVDEYFKKGFFPTAKTNFHRGFSTFFTTIGFIGLWECVEALIDNEDSLLTAGGLELGKTILSLMAETVAQFTEENGCLFNMEATPAESATYKLAKKGLKHFPDMPHRGLKKSPYFTNSCHIPVEYQGELELVFKTQNELQPICSGGTVVHFYVGEQMTPEQVEGSVRFICENTHLPYFSLTTVYSICPICGRIPGAHEVCPNKHTPEQIAKLEGSKPDMVMVHHG